jgi:hypothetical protein
VLATIVYQGGMHERLRIVYTGRKCQRAKENLAMAKVFGMHMIVLNPGVDTDEFEKFAAEAVPGMTPWEGWKGYLLKGDRGDREGKYMWLIEIDSVEARDRIIPSHNVASEEAQQREEALSEEEKQQQQEMAERLATFTPSIVGENTVYTDYLVIAETD